MPNRTIAIGDIHGCHIALERLLRELKIAADDTVVVLGDVIDRGPGTKSAVDQLIALQEICPVILVLGNHEEMLLEARERGGGVEAAWLRFGGQQTLESYGGGYGMIPKSHWKFIKTGRDYWETESEVFIHGSLDSVKPLSQQSPDWLRWTRVTGKESPLPCGRRVICGHSSLETGVPLVWDGWVCIDTWCYGNGYLSALDVTNDLLYQARQTGDARGPFPLADIPS